MSLQELVAQTTREVPSALMRETFIAPKMLPVCCVCELIRDETTFPPDRERWVTPQAYRQTHGVNPTKLVHTHTYCPECFTKVQDSVKQYFWKIGTPA